MSFGAPSPWPGTDVAEDTGKQGEWDSIWIGTKAVPGLVTVKATIGRKIQTRQSPAKDGASITLLNYELAQIDVLVRMWTETHFNLWLELCADIQPNPSASSKKAWDVINTALSAQGISKAVVLSVSVPERGAGREIDVWHATIKLREWRKPVAGSKHKTPTASQAQVPLGKSFAKVADEAAPSATNTGP